MALNRYDDRVTIERAVVGTESTTGTLRRSTHLNLHKLDAAVFEEVTAKPPAKPPQVEDFDDLRAFSRGYNLILKKPGMATTGDSQQTAASDCGRPIVTDGDGRTPRTDK